MIRNIKKICKSAIYPLLIFVGTGCDKDFLNEQNKSAITQENYFTTAAQAEAAITGIYPQLQSFTSSTGRSGEVVWASLEMPVGHANSRIVYNSNLIQHTSAPIDPAFRILWEGFYNGIANANVAINRIPPIEMDEAKKNALLGQAYFLRAFYYYYLVRLYGDIPLITGPIDFSSPDLYPSRNQKEKVYDLIVSDLLRAENSGLPNVDRTGKVSLGAVKSLLSSVYLTMAGHPLNKGAEFYKLAADKAEEVIDAGWYPLFNNYASLHNRPHKNQGEFIFQVQYLAGVQNSNITQYVTPTGSNISKMGTSWGSIMPRSEFVESYEPNDLRAKEKQFFFSQYPSTKGGEIVKFGEYALYKFWLEEAAGPNGDGIPDQNWTLLRLPEVLLIYAEASNEVTGPTEKAYNQINKIRGRAGLKPLIGLSKEEFREAIWRERYHELAFENKAYFDIQRTRKAYNLQKGNFTDVFTYKNESGVTFKEQYMLWPIPQSELDANPNLKQNPGW